MNTFIIGNGVDLAHNMPTNYNCFKDYLLERFPYIKGFKEELFFVPSQRTAPNGGIIVDQNEVASFLYHIINNVCGEDWSDFETALGNIDLFECFDDLFEVYDRDGDRNVFHEAYNNEDRASDLYYVIPMIKVFFSDWVNTIKPPKRCLPDFSSLIDPEKDLFISFNYSHTLEELYRCKNVIHMHGEIGSEIIVGHDGRQDYSDDNSSVPIGCFNTLQEIYDMLRKDTEGVIEKHYDELRAVSFCKQVYSFGFSYSQVDIPYIKHICGLLKDDVIWLFTKYDARDSTKIVRFKKDIVNCGFKGQFSIF